MNPSRDLFSLGVDLQLAFSQAASEWQAAGNTQKLWHKDASLWTSTDEAQWLGWLDIVDQQLGETSKFKAFAAEIREDAFSHILLLGMGGSSLCPEVFSLTFGKQSGFPELLVLDSTAPEQIRSLRQKIDPARTLFCVSSKSGTTLELNIYLRYFYDETQKVVGEGVGNHFFAITDAGSPLEAVAAELKFRRVYHGLPGIGGRYSALSNFGLIPHAAAGLDTEKLLKQTALMVAACQSSDTSANPGVSLGLALGTAATQFQRDKVTLLCSESIRSLGAWLEQLLAESTCKQGLGLILIDQEPAVHADRYGADRIFVSIRYAGDNDEPEASLLGELEAAGQPVIRILLKDLTDIGQLFFQWEIATAVAASLLEVNPFNQPDVEASKVVTRELISEFERNGMLAAETPLLHQEGLALFTDQGNAEVLLKGSHTIGAVLRCHLDRLQPGDYFGLLAYIPMFPECLAKFQEIRQEIVESRCVATVLGFGPRFLHSTAQSYEGGHNSGVFLQITCQAAEDLPIPGQKYSFAVVQAAQARSDFQVLVERHRRVLRVHLAFDLTKNLERLRDLVFAALSR